MVAFESRREYWYICAKTGKLLCAGCFDNHSDCEQTLEEEGKDAAFIFAINVSQESWEVLPKKTRDVS